MRALLASAVTLALLSSAQAQDIGVPVCDKMLKTYETCVMVKSPPQAQAQMKATFEQMRSNWKAVAATADGKKQLEPVCVQTTEQMKSQLASFNCAW